MNVRLSQKMQLTAKFCNETIIIWYNYSNSNKFDLYYEPFNAQEDTGVPFHQNFNSILRRDHQKISYERRAYESVDEKSLS